MNKPKTERKFRVSAPRAVLCLCLGVAFALAGCVDQHPEDTDAENAAGREAAGE